MSVLRWNFEMFQNNHTHGVEYGSIDNYRRTIREASQESSPGRLAAPVLASLSSSDVLDGTVPAGEFDIPVHIEIPMCP